MNWNFVFKLIPYILLFTNKLMRKILFSSFFFIFFYMKNWINILISPLFIPSSSSSSWIKPQQNIIDYIHINSKNYVNIKAKGIWKGTHNGHPRSLNLDQRNGCESFDQRACEFFFFFSFPLFSSNMTGFYGTLGILTSLPSSHVVKRLHIIRWLLNSPFLYIYISLIPHLSTQLSTYISMYINTHACFLSIYRQKRTIEGLRIYINIIYKWFFFYFR